MGWNSIEQSLYKKAHDQTSKMYIKYQVFKKTMESISFDYRRGVEEDTRDQIPKLCNTVEPEEVPEETKVEDEDKKKVVTQKLYKYHNPLINLFVFEPKLNKCLYLVSKRIR